MKIACIGGGPAGLYFAISMKLHDPAHDIAVFERNPPGVTFGWGVVFSDQTLANLRAADEPTYRAITDAFAHWDDIDIHVGGRVITSGGHGFSGIGRKALLRILQARAAELGVETRFETEVASLGDLERLGLGGADLVVGADGVNSTVRRERADAFRPTLDARSARYIWLGTPKKLDAFTFIFAETEHGVFQVHGYRFDRDHSTFIVECDEASWRAAGLDRMDTPASVAFCERLFAPWLDGHPLISNAAHRGANPWVRFLKVSCDRWFDGNVVLVGDAAHTAHFSIGSGTKLAMEDAIVLAREVASGKPLAVALAAYEAERKLESLRLQNAARNSMEWFENVRRYIHLEPEQFAYSLLTRSQRVSHENLRLRDRAWLEGYERWWALQERRNVGEEERKKGDPSSSPPLLHTSIPSPPMFVPFRVRGVELANRRIALVAGLAQAGRDDRVEITGQARRQRPCPPSSCPSRTRRCAANELVSAGAQAAFASERRSVERRRRIRASGQVRQGNPRGSIIRPERKKTFHPISPTNAHKSTRIQPARCMHRHVADSPDGRRRLRAEPRGGRVRGAPDAPGRRRRCRT
mgnify:CR=1 FL=1